MLRIAVCDDNDALANEIEQDLLGIRELNVACDVYRSGLELTRRLQEGEDAYHIYFMDIEMPCQNGIETAAVIRERDQDALIIFITDYKEYVYDVFEVLPFRFLQKPVSAEELRRILTEAAEQIRRTGQIYFFRIGHGEYQLYYREIVYFEGAGRKVRIRSEKESYEVYDKISSVITRLDGSMFVQIHASYIVNMEFIRSIHNAELVVQDGSVLPVSKKFRGKVKQAHLAFLERRCGI